MDNQKLALAITKALAFQENGGMPDVKNLKAGKTGETKSIFQFLPETWKKDSKEVLGDGAEMTPENEAEVVHNKVSKWIDEDEKAGFSPDVIPQRIASRWNAGGGEPDAYTGKFSTGKPSKGVNEKYGVGFDVPTYAKKVKDYTDEFLKELGGSDTSSLASKAPEIKPQNSQKQEGLLASQAKAPKAVKANPGLINEGVV